MAQSESWVQPLGGVSHWPLVVLQMRPAAQSASLVQPPGTQLPLCTSQISPPLQSALLVQPVGGGV